MCTSIRLQLLLSDILCYVYFPLKRHFEYYEKSIAAIEWFDKMIEKDYSMVNHNYLEFNTKYQTHWHCNCTYLGCMRVYPGIGVERWKVLTNYNIIMQTKVVLVLLSATLNPTISYCIYPAKNANCAVLVPACMWWRSNARCGRSDWSLRVQDHRMIF